MMTVRKNATGRAGDLAHSLTVGSWLFTVTVVTLLFFPSLERKFAPVVIDGQWGEVVEVVEGGIIVSGSATKVRECGWLETRFYIGVRNGLSSYLPRAQHLGPPAARPEGQIEWERIFLPVTRLQFERGFVFADALHDCYGIEHVTRSHLFE